LLKLGIAISERTVSRYLRGRPPTRSQTWRTFFANHFGNRTFISPVMFADASGDDIVDASDVSVRPTQLSINGSCVSAHWPSIAMFPSNQRFLECASGKIIFRTVQAHTRARAGTRRIHGCNAWRPATGSFGVCLQYLFDRRHREVMLASPTSTVVSLRRESSRQRRRRRTVRWTATWSFATSLSRDLSIGEAQALKADADLRNATVRRPMKPYLKIGATRETLNDYDCLGRRRLLHTLGIVNLLESPAEDHPEIRCEIRDSPRTRTSRPAPITTDNELRVLGSLAEAIAGLRAVTVLAMPSLEDGARQASLRAFLDELDKTALYLCPDWNGPTAQQRPLRSSASRGNPVRRR
jgi:hypothetical protein